MRTIFFGGRGQDCKKKVLVFHSLKILTTLHNRMPSFLLISLIHIILNFSCLLGEARFLFLFRIYDMLGCVEGRHPLSINKSIR